MILVFMLTIVIISETSAFRTCRPIISEGSLGKVELGEYIFLDCLIATCKDVIVVIFEKTGLENANKWTPVLEGFRNNTLNTLDVAESSYSLMNRYSYKAFRTKHTLNIKHLILEDGGEWRCVVFDPNMKYPSNSMEVSIYVIPEEDSISITSQNEVLLVDRIEEFTCTIDGIYPEPVVVWQINDKEYSGSRSSNTKQANGLWSVKNSLKFSFSRIGETAIKCIMKIDTSNRLLERRVNKEIKEHAKITYPVAEMNVNTNAYSTFTLNCACTGYIPSITWSLDGEEIAHNDTGYIIDQQCNTLICESSITSKPVGGCLDMLQYTGIYKCVMTSEQPYSSTQKSPNMVVNIPIKQCIGEYDGLKLNFTLWIAKFVSLTVVFVGLISAAVVFYRYRIKEALSQTTVLKTDQREPLIDADKVSEYVARRPYELGNNRSIKSETMAKICELLQSLMCLTIPTQKENIMFRQLVNEEYYSFRKILKAMMLKFNMIENKRIDEVATNIRGNVNDSGFGASINTLIDSVSTGEEANELDSEAPHRDSIDELGEGDRKDIWKKTMAKIFELFHSVMINETGEEKEILLFKQLHDEDYKSLRKMIKAMIIKFNVNDNSRIGPFAEEVNNIEQIALDSHRVKFMTSKNYSTGSLRIEQSSAFADFITIGNTGASVADVNGYSMKRIVDGRISLTYTIVEAPKLNAGRDITFWAEGSKPQNTTSTDIIAIGVKSWGFGDEMITTLIDTDTQVRSVMKQNVI